MQSKPDNKRRFFKNSYLLITAVCFIILSFFVENYWSGNSSVATVGKQIENYIHSQELDFNKLTADTGLLRRISNKQYDEKELDLLAAKPYFFFHYFVNDIGQQQLNFWNSQTVLPGSGIRFSADSIGFALLENGYYVWLKKNTAAQVTIALIPVKWNYFITNKYLQNTFATGKEIERNYDIAAGAGGTAIRSKSGKPLFSLTEKPGSVVPKNNRVTIWLRIMASLLLLLFIHLLASAIASKQSLGKALFFLLPTIIVLRWISYYFPIPINFRQFELFNPMVYASNVFLPSLGDLLINSVLFTWILFFIHNRIYKRKTSLANQKPVAKWLILIGVCIALLAAAFAAGQIISGMVADSNISFDVINFFTLNIYSIIGFGVLCCIAIAYFLLSRMLLYLVKPLLNKKYWELYLTIAVCGLIFLSFQMSVSYVLFRLYILTWLLLYVFLLNREDLETPVTRINSTRLIFWLFFFSVTITSVIVSENGSKELRKRKYYAETLSTKSNPGSERLLNSLLTDFRNDYLAANFYRFSSNRSNQFFKDSLVNGNFSGYTNNYETKIFTFDAKEAPLFNQEDVGFDELNAVLKTQAKPTNIPGLFYYDESYDRFSYISRITVTNYDIDTMGYVFVLANPKKHKTEALNLELFSRGEDNAIEHSTKYAFAVYNNLKLINSHNDYAFATRLNAQEVPTVEFTRVNKNGYDELWYKASPGEIVIITKENNFFIEAITLFSYMFCAFLLVAGLFWLLNIMIRARLNKEKIKYYWQLSIRNQIHGTVIFISVLSFLVIGLATILFFISRYHNSNREKLSRVIHVMENEVRISLSEMSVADNPFVVGSDEFAKTLEKTIGKISEIHAVDINLYDLDGNLRVSSLPLPYNKGVISKKMDPLAFYILNQKKQVQYFQTEEIGNLSFISNYVPVIDATGREYAYLNIPYFTSESKLQEEIANFLVTIINLNAFIFLIAGIIALFITNRITRSFSLISEKMKAVNLGQHNEAIEWNRHDEIGELVGEYNKMVAKLDEGALALAKSERESAWREMARQVAHEIKNPLTPMKLSLQYLQKSIINKSPNVAELTAGVAKTLVEQIEHLNHIAGEFSQFANIGNPKNEIFNLNEIINTVVELHAIDDRIHIYWNPAVEQVLVEADKTHQNRLFTNLILNAMQAIPGERTVEIQITEEVKDDKVLIKVKDNGMGIPGELQAKIFTPNFTTKTSGTGLGLAMSKGIVEQARGRIWFETEEGVGTTFFIELPVHQVAQTTV
ncbi:MAG: HAMP domain-containing histidine kinase [Chitinophagaceae bacterium]|nr:HAMP domain-containing histidine kinase [Chitinophagaceae bacterium]